MNTYKSVLLLGALLFAPMPVVFAQANPGGPGKGAGGPPEMAERGSEQSQAVRALLRQFQERRQQFIAERHELVKKLQGLPEAERKQILEELRLQQQGRVEEHRALAREIREEMRRMREQRREGPTG
jgi:hypothetical protein